jgi:hypothetical protein
VALIWIAVALVAATRLASSGAARVVVQGGLLLVAALSLGRAVELNWLLVSDARYQAEAWMAANLPPAARTEVYQKAAFLPRFPAPLQSQFVPIGERTAAGLTARQPDAIVTSSASRKSITHIWTPDWRTTGTMLTPNPDATAFLAALESGALPYRLAEVFRQEPHLLTNRITSVAPEIRIYVRTP